MDQEAKIKELDEQLANILEERLKIVRQIDSPNLDEETFRTKLEGKATTLILNEIFKEFEKEDS